MNIVNKISLSKICRKYKNTSISKILCFLIEQNLLIVNHNKINTDETFISNSNMIEIDNKKVLIDEELFLKFINNNIDYFKFSCEERLIYNYIIDPTILKTRLSTLKDKTFMFIDCEYKNGDYYEIAFNMVKNNVIMDSQYIFIDLEVRKMDKLRKKNVTFQINSRQEINRKIKENLKFVDFIISHNAFGEREILKKNGLELSKEKFLCTADITKKLNNLPKIPNFIEACRLYNIKLDHGKLHYAYYDCLKTQELFTALIS